MGKTLFNSTLEEKKTLRKRLLDAPEHEEVETAILIVEDSILLHEAHKTIAEMSRYASALFNSQTTGNDTKKHANMIRSVADEFYKYVDKQKARR